MTTRAEVGLGISGATRCQYCASYHAEAARLFGATEEEITEAMLFAKSSMGWSTFINGMQLNYETFRRELDAIVAHVKTTVPAAA